MRLTVKLGPELELELSKKSEEQGISRSAVVKQALIEYFAKEPPSAYELGKDLIGRYSSGKSDGSTHRHGLYAEIVNAKHGRHR